MKVYSSEYTTCYIEQNKLIDLDNDQSLLQHVMSFNREQFVVDIQSRIKYYKINNMTDHLNLLDQFKDQNILIVHQDSERDLIIIT